MKLKKVRIIIVLTVLALTILIPDSGLFSQSQNCIEQAKQAAVIVAKTLMEKGFSLSGTTPRVGALREGQSAGFQTLLMKGNLYAFVVAGGCVHNIVLYIYDENKNLIGQYDGGKPFAAVMIQPNWTGQAYGVVTVKGTSEDPAVVVQLMGWRQI
jgi:hypothetical protein